MGSLAGLLLGRTPMQHRLPIGVLGAGLAALCLPLTALAQTYWPAFPASPETRSTQGLFWVVVGIAFVLLLVVEGLLVTIMVRFRQRPGAGEPRQVYANRRLEFWWTAIPFAILIVVFGLTVQAVAAQTTVRADALPVTVIGHQWWWELRYPTLGVVAANELHVPTGRQIKLTLQSADVVHNFWVPVLAGKEQLIPGASNVWSFTTQQPGTYSGACSEYCGGAHAWMLISVMAQPSGDFDTWAAQQRQPASVPLAANQQAQQLFDQKACGQCHTIRGTEAAGTVGPDLTHVGSRQTIASGRLVNNMANMTAWIDNPQAPNMKPSSLMPNLHLTRDEATVLAQYLDGLK